MSRHRRSKPFRRRSAPGAPPGQVVAISGATRPIIHVLAYDHARLVEKTFTDVAQLDTLEGPLAVTWIHVVGIDHGETIRALGARYGLHPLAMEDVVHPHQRPKLEPYDRLLFIVARMVMLEEQLESEQVSLFVGSEFVLTFIEDPGDVFDPVRNRLRTHSGQIREASAGYLAYALLDALIDAHFPVLEALGERLEALEDEIVLRPEPAMIPRMHALKRDLRALRREMWPLREVCSLLSREHWEQIDAETRVYLRDCYDHTVQILDLVETYRELGADLTDLYLSSQGHRMNEIMKVLTIIATLFMPLSFIVGVYGMNFDSSLPGNMPELHWPYAYVGVWIVILIVTLGMLGYFFRKGWIGQRFRRDKRE